MNQLKLVVNIKSFWHAGTGQSSGYHLDALQNKTNQGTPLLTGKHLKGLLREACREAESLGWFDDYANDYAAHDYADNKHTDKSASVTDLLFGTEQRPGMLFFENARLEEDDYLKTKEGQKLLPYLYQQHFSTALENGVAKEKSLRGMEVAMPMVLNSHIGIDVVAHKKEWQESQQALAERAPEILRQITPLVTHVGAKRTRGYGEAQLSIRHLDSGMTKQTSSAPVTANRQRYDLLLELEQPVVVSETAATSGNHSCVNYIPGSVLLGSIAGSLYRKFGQKRVDALFNSGDIRLLNAYVTTANGQRTRPVPLSFHYYKAHGDRYQERAEYGNRMLQSSQIENLTQVSGKSGEQLKQIRGLYIDQAGFIGSVHKQYSMKTAIDPSSGVASSGQLYGYEALEAGQTFRSSLEFSKNVDLDIKEAVLDVLRKPLRLGRARSAEYGKVNAILRTAEDKSVTDKALGDCSKSRCVLWLASDMALNDAYGQPTVQPAKAVGLPAFLGTFVPEHSFIRTRRYSPFNGKRRSYDPERHVISAGSVLVFDCSASTDVADAKLSPELRLGLFTEQGLGEIYANPTMLQGGNPQFLSAKGNGITRQDGSTGETGKKANQNSSLITFLQSVYSKTTLHENAYQHAQRIVNLVSQFTDDIRKEKEINANQVLENFPAKAQWGSIQKLADDTRLTPKELKERVWVDQGQSILANGAAGTGWLLTRQKDDCTLKDLLTSELKEVPPEKLALVASHLAKQVTANWDLVQKGEFHGK